MTPTKAEKTHSFAAIVGNSQHVIDARVEKQGCQSRPSNQRWRAVRTITAASIQQKAAESKKRRLEGEVQEDAVLVSPKKPRIGLTEEEIRALGRAMKQEVTESTYRLLARDGITRKYGKDGTKVETVEGKYKRVDEENKNKEDKTEEGETEGETEGEMEEESDKWKEVDEAVKVEMEAGAGETKIKAQMVEEGERGKDGSNDKGKEEQKSDPKEEESGKDGSTSMPGSSSLADFSSEEESPVTTAATS